MNNKMTEEAKARLREIAKRKVKLHQLEAVDWHAAIDHCLEERDMEKDLRFMRAGCLLHAMSFVPPSVVLLMAARLPSYVVTLKAGPNKTRTVPAFYWLHLVSVYKFLGIYGQRKNGGMKLASREIRFPKNTLLNINVPF